MSLASFTKAYIEAALWSSTDNNDEPLDTNYTRDDLTTETLVKMHDDCKQFYNEHCALWDDDERAGHDFWLSRNGHGSGYFAYPEFYGINADLLQEHSHTYGEYNLYIGDDELIYGA